MVEEEGSCAGMSGRRGQFCLSCCVFGDVWHTSVCIWRLKGGIHGYS